MYFDRDDLATDRATFPRTLNLMWNIWLSLLWKEQLEMVFSLHLNCIVDLGMRPISHTCWLTRSDSFASNPWLTHCFRWAGKCLGRVENDDSWLPQTTGSFPCRFERNIGTLNFILKYEIVMLVLLIKPL